MLNKLKNLLFGSLRKQLMVGMTLVIVLMMTLFVWNMTSRQQEEEISSHSQQVTALAESAATSSAVSVASRDYSGLQEIVFGIARYPNLSYIIVLDLRGQVLAHSNPSKIGLYLNDLPQQQEKSTLHRTANLLEVITPITLAGTHIGWVRLGIDRSHFKAEVAQTRRDGLVFTLIGIVFSILIAFVAGRILTHRLAVIQQVAEEVNEGNSTERVELAGDDEAAKLARQFNSMLDSLAQRDEQLRSFYEFDIVGLTITSPDKGWIKINQCLCNMLEYSEQELRGMNWAELTHPDDLAADVEQFNRLLANEIDGYSLEKRFISKSGRVIPTYLVVRCVRKEDGEVDYLTAMVQDLTERKLSEEKISKSERELNKAQQIAHVGSWYLNLATNEVEWSEELYKMYGFNPALPPPPYTEHQKLFTPESWELLSSSLAITREAGIPYELELRTVKGDGSNGWMWVRGEAIKNVEGKVAGLWGAAQDITERKRSEEKLKSNEERMRIFFDNVPLGIFSSTREGKFVYVNPALPKMLGYDSCEDIVEVVNRTSVAQTLYVEPPRRQAIMQELDQDYNHWKTYENRYRRKDGQIIDAIVSIGERLDVATGEPIFDGIVTDITERKKIEEIQSFLAKTTSSHMGESFFEELARYLSQSLGMFYVCIDRLEGDALKATTLAIWCDDKFEDNVTYSLKDTPCGDVVGNKVCCFPASVCQYFPRDQVLQDLCAESYIGVTLFGHSGKPIGLIAVIGREPLANRPLAESILKLVADRASGELERLFAEEKLQLSANVFSHSREGILITEIDGTIVDINEAFTRITGYSRDEVVGKNPRILSSGRQSKEFYAALWLDLNESGYWTGEVWNRRKNGEVYAELITISAVKNTEGETQHYVALFSDISVLKEHEQQLEQIAHYDTLTNLPNRVLLADRLHQSMTQAQRRNQRLAVVYLDLDGFKAINDSHGHHVGDQLLIAVATRMKQALREGDTLARIGGDEFVAVLLDLADVESSVPMLERLLAAAAQLVEINGIVLHISASLGVTFYPQMESVDADQLMRQADQAMYQAKLEGRNRYSVFDAEHDNSIRGLHENLDEISRALLAREFVLHYQPKVNMVSGAVVGAEALIRWRHPEKGIVPPGVFLPVIEEHQLAVKIGEWVIDTALNQMELWQQAGLDIPVSVNVGALQLQQTGFVKNLRAALAAHPDVKPSCLEIEVLETSALKEVTRVSQVMNECREIGVSFALDDFGTGYSSLSYLRRFPISKIKIDQSFVRDMTFDQNDQVMVQTIIDMAKNFNLNVIAEGVETENQLMLLKQLGCIEYQGYLFSKPVPVEQFEALLNKV